MRQHAFTAVFFLFALVLLAAPLFAAPPTIADLVKADQGAPLTLRGFYTGNALHFDSNGNVLGDARRGLWTTDGSVEIASAEFNADNVKLRCARWWALFEGPAGEKRVLERVNRDVEITIDTVPGANSVATFKAALRNIFLSGKEELVDIVPPLWKPYLARPIDPRVQRFREESQKPKTSADSPAAPATQSADAASAVDPNSPLGARRHAGGALSRPIHLAPAEAEARLIHEVEPDFSEQAGGTHLRGTVVLGVTVSPIGEPLDIYVLRPLGAGFDEAAAEAVRQWKYKPYTYEGSLVYFETEVKLEFKRR
jgi:TonB family protein